jgi:hypothetical protein
MTKRKIKLPMKEQKIALYQMAGEIKKIAPWENLWDMDTICIKFADRKEAIYCSVMGRHGNCYAIALFDGERAASTLNRMASVYNEDGYQFRAMGMQDAVTVYWGNRDELSAEERREIKELGFSFRGANNWIYFRRLMPECMPGPIHAEHADLLLKTLPQVIAAYKDYLLGGHVLKDDMSEAIWREQNGSEWTTKIMQDFDLPDIITNLTFNDAKDKETGLSLFARLQSSDFEEGGELELDVFSMPVASGQNEEGYDKIMHNLMLVEPESGFIISSRILKSDDIIGLAMVNELVAVILGSKRRPEVIHVFDTWTAALIEDFCEKLGITVDDTGVPFIDQIANDMCGKDGMLGRMFR